MWRVVGAKKNHLFVLYCSPICSLFYLTFSLELHNNSSAILFRNHAHTFFCSILKEKVWLRSKMASRLAKVSLQCTQVRNDHSFSDEIVWSSEWLKVHFYIWPKPKAKYLKKFGLWPNTGADFLIVNVITVLNPQRHHPWLEVLEKKEWGLCGLKKD